MSEVHGQMSDYCTKKEVVSRNGMVVAKHQLVAETGIKILKNGGNAVDAAVAASLASGVVEPVMGGIGGVVYIAIYLSDTKEGVFVWGGGRAPEKARPDVYELEPERKSSSYRDQKAVKDNAMEVGYKSVCVPGFLSGLTKALDMYGSMNLKEVMQPAIKYAEEGFLIDWFDTALVGASMRKISKNSALTKILLRDGYPLAPSWSPPLCPADRLVQKDLARTLRLISNGGADVFYKGSIAQSIVDDMEKNGGLLSISDLASYEPDIVKAVPGDYRGYDVLYAPLTFSAGPMVMETLNILEGYNLTELGHNSSKSLHILCQALKLAFADYYSMGDPDFVKVSVEKIVSKEHASEQRKKIEVNREALETKLGEQPRDSAGCTTHLGVVDKNRNMVSITHTTAGEWGSGVVTPGTGIMLNSAMAFFDPEPGNPFSVAPRKRPTTPCTPILVLKNGSSFLNVGAPGNNRIQASLVQVTTNVIDHGMSIQKAMEAPRIDCGSCVGVEMIADSRISQKKRRELKKMGHKISLVKDSPWVPGGHLQAFAIPVGILVDSRKGRLRGGVEPNRRNLAVGY